MKAQKTLGCNNSALFTVRVIFTGEILFINFYAPEVLYMTSGKYT